ncbi:MAG TPA: hypothetical protein PK970_09930, partial [Hyphomicrobiaceae bacterium]|nr:hypothetical protein [Hyphomicrobiaceae bacterium]
MSENKQGGGFEGGFGPEKIWPLIAAGMAVLMGWQYFQSQQPPGEKVAMLRANNPDGTPGGRVTRADCVAQQNRVWISTEDFTECIAYVAAEAPAGAANTGTGLIFFNGDVPEAQRADQAKPNVAAAELKRALFGEGRALAEALMVQAAIEHDAGQPQQALALWRAARDMLLNDRATLAQLRAEDIEGYLDLLFDLAGTDATTGGNALLDEAFTVSQLGQTPAAG